MSRKAKLAEGEEPPNETPWARAKREKKPYVHLDADARTVDPGEEHVSFSGPATPEEARAVVKLILHFIENENRADDGEPLLPCPFTRLKQQQAQIEELSTYLKTLAGILKDCDDDGHFDETLMRHRVPLAKEWHLCVIEEIEELLEPGQEYRPFAEESASPSPPPKKPPRKKPKKT